MQPLEAWACHAKPAALGGKTCGHVNETGGITYAGRVCCAECGATKVASDARSERPCECCGDPLAVPSRAPGFVHVCRRCASSLTSFGSD